jgi:hypothetical protein
MYNVVCRSMTIEARYANDVFGASREVWTDRNCRVFSMASRCHTLDKYLHKQIQNFSKAIHGSLNWLRIANQIISQLNQTILQPNQIIFLAMKTAVLLEMINLSTSVYSVFMFIWNQWCNWPHTHSDGHSRSQRIQHHHALYRISLLVVTSEWSQWPLKTWLDKKSLITFWPFKVIGRKNCLELDIGLIPGHFHNTS